LTVNGIFILFSYEPTGITKYVLGTLTSRSMMFRIPFTRFLVTSRTICGICLGILEILSKNEFHFIVDRSNRVEYLIQRSKSTFVISMIVN